MTQEQDFLSDSQEQDFLTDKDWHTELVGEGKKYSDDQALARSRIEADWHIQRIERENADLRRERDSRIKMEDFIDRMEKFRNNSDTSNGQLPDDQENTQGTASITAEDVERLIERKEQTRQRAENLREVDTVLKEKLGPNYAPKVRNTMDELGYSTEAARELAAANPKAFYRLLGLDSKTTERFEAPVKSAVNSLSFKSTGNKKNFAYYEDLRKKEPSGYLPPNLYLEMEREAIAQGDSFYN